MKLKQTYFVVREIFQNMAMKMTVKVMMVHVGRMIAIGMLTKRHGEKSNKRKNCYSGKYGLA